MNTSLPPEGAHDTDGAWFGFWLQFIVLGGLAILGLYVASDGRSGDYATGLLLTIGAVLLAFLRLKSWFDGNSADWTSFLFVDKPAHLVVVIPLFSIIALGGLFVAAGEPGTLHAHVEFHDAEHLGAGSVHGVFLLDDADMSEA